MTPILGIMASQISGHLYAPTGSMYHIASTTLGSGVTTSIEFTSIPADYTHLQIRAIAKTDRADSALSAMDMTFNGDVSAWNYSWHEIYADGSTVTAGGNSGTQMILFERVAGNTGATNIFSAHTIDILDYANTNKYKTTRGLNGLDLNGSGVIDFSSGNWRNTAAITSIKFVADYNTTGFKQYSSFALYGVK